MIINNEAIIKLCDEIMDSWSHYQTTSNGSDIKRCIYCDASARLCEDLLHKNDCIALVARDIKSELTESLERVTFDDLKKLSKCTAFQYEVKFKIYGDSNDMPLRTGSAMYYIDYEDNGSKTRIHKIESSVKVNDKEFKIVFDESLIQEMYLIKSKTVMVE